MKFYTYDNNGNQRTLETPTSDITTNTWSYENQIASIENALGERTTYTYALVNRIGDEYQYKKETDTGAGVETIKYLWDKHNILQEYDVTTEAQYNYQPQAFGNLISQYRDDAESSYYHYDGNMSTSAMTDASEVETDTYSYTAWGEEKSSTGTTVNPYTYKGQIGYYQDEDGLQLLRNRRYSPEQGNCMKKGLIFLREYPPGGRYSSRP